MLLFYVTKKILHQGPLYSLVLLNLNSRPQRYNEPHIEQIRIRSTANEDDEATSTATANTELEEEELGVEEDEEEEEEFTPSAWNAALAPHRSALRSPDKTLKSGVSRVVDRQIIRRTRSDSKVHEPCIACI